MTDTVIVPLVERGMRMLGQALSRAGGPSGATPEGIVVQIELIGSLGRTYHAVLGAQDMPVHEGSHSSPSLILKLEADVFLDLSSRPMSLPTFITAGKVAVAGDPRLVDMLVAPPRDGGKKDALDDRGKRAVEQMTRALRIEQIDRASRVSIADWQARYASRSVPVILVGELSSARVPTLADVRRAFGNERVNVRLGDYAAKIYGLEMDTADMRFDTYLDRISAEAPSHGLEPHPPPYAANNPIDVGRLADIDYPRFYRRDEFYPAKLWVGPRDTLTPLHRDWADNFLLQLVGRKHLLLLPPSNAETLYVREVHPLLDSCVALGEREKGNCELPESTVRCECVLEPGEMLYLPAGWFHEVRAISLSVSVTFAVVGLPRALASVSPLQAVAESI